ncbi:MAG: hypothetical protein U0670_16410 [Anaerolineae bacterium]
MAFTYMPFATDRDRLRFHIGDTEMSAPIFQDEELDALISVEGSWQAAVIAALERLIALTSQPNFQADWLHVNNEVARRGYELSLKHKRRAFRLGGLASAVVQGARVDE